MNINGFQSRRDLVSRLEDAKQYGTNLPVRIALPGREDLFKVYPASVRKSKKGGIFMAGTFNHRRALFLLGKSNLKVFGKYEGKVVYENADFVIKKCRITRTTLDQLRHDFPFCAPVGLPSGSRSLAFRDALGLAGKAQLRAFAGLAGLTMSRQCFQQIRELELHPEDALDAATWTVFQEGYEEGIAAEACHVCTVSGLRTMLQAGYTRFSIEPVDRDTGHLREATKQELLDRIIKLPWPTLRDKFELVFNRYSGKRVELGPIGSTVGGTGMGSGIGAESAMGLEQKPLMITPNEGEILSSICKFSETILQIVELENVLFTEGVRDNVTLEISFARCSEELTPFEHYFLISELLRRDIQTDYIAPGSLDPEHVLLAQQSGGYGLSGNFDSRREWQLFVEESLLPGVPLHGIFPDISYMTALQCIVVDDKELFRSIWETSRNRFENVRKKSGTTLKIDHIELATDYSDDSLPKLLERPYTDAFLTITLPEIMTIRDSEGNRFLRKKLYNYLYNHEGRYTDALLAEYGRIS